MFVRNHPKFFRSVTQLPRLRKRDLTKLVVPSHKTVLFTKNCYYMCTLVYNKIPKEFREFHLVKFKKTLKDWLITKCYYSLQEFYDDN